MAMSIPSNVITDIPRAGDEDQKTGIVHIQYGIDDLKAKNKEAVNADITDIKFNEWGFSVMVRGHQKGKLQGKVYMPFIVTLPYEIVPKKCSITVKDNFVYMNLKKKDVYESWENEIRLDTLETADDGKRREFLTHGGQRSPTAE